MGRLEYIADAPNTHSSSTTHISWHQVARQGREKQQQLTTRTSPLQTTHATYLLRQKILTSNKPRKHAESGEQAQHTCVWPSPGKKIGANREKNAQKEIVELRTTLLQQYNQHSLFIYCSHVSSQHHIGITNKNAIQRALIIPTTCLSFFGPRVFRP